MQPVPPPATDITQIETRLLVLAEILDQAVSEVRRTAQEIRRGGGASPTTDDDAKERHVDQ